jgi:hypothetical protein
VHLESLLRSLGRIVLPQRVDQPACRDDIVRIKEQHRQKCALLPAAEIEDPAIGRHLQRAEDPKLHAQKV